MGRFAFFCMGADKIITGVTLHIVNDEIAAVWEFCKIHDDDIIVIPSIITREDYRWRWYWKAVVSAMTHKMLEQWFVPQYRCDPENIGSRELAKSLWYEEIIDWFSSKLAING